ncbi:YEATS domain-containing protein 2 [Gopherus flavomarginatus]|uniref:YEATS domain-containing protein 2 n=1 Tax=Gopherus flavomarginatus TaxID=286002 RepID=UPI0021CBD8B4|nr:YEATS domain-containing protein 2 [Gopherus flavomarginatus]
MSGIKRVIEEKDPDYEEISVTHPNKRHKAAEQSARDAAVQKIETIIKEQFAVEMKNKEHEIEVIDQRLLEARRMMDKLRACIVANYYASAGLLKVGEGAKTCDSMVFNHPSIKKFLESPSRSSSPANHGSETPSANHSESDSLSQHNDFLLEKDNGNLDMEERLANNLYQRPSRNTGRVTLSCETGGGQKDTSGVTSSHKTGQRKASLLNDETSRLYVKKTIVVGNVSKYIPPDKREENDQSTHKWMVYVRGSRREPSINHFVKKVWFFLHPSYKPNDLVEVREPPFHLTRRGWGEFPVRVQIHFKDSQNKRIDIIHNLKLDRTYTGLQTLGAETVVDVELHRHSLGEDYLFSQSSESDLSDVPTSLPLPLSVPAPVKASSPIKQLLESIPDASVDKGFPVNAETERHTTFYSLPSSVERTPTKLATQKVTFGSHGNSAFQPIAASCKIIPQGQIPSPAESPGKSFQPITMSCKIVSVASQPDTMMLHLPGTFLVGQPSPQHSGKQLAPASVVQGSVGAGASSTQGQQALKVITGQKTALFAQAAPGGQTSLMKISDGSLKSVPASSQLSKPGTTVLRVSGGMITAATTPAMSLPANGISQQVDGAGSSSSSTVGPVAKTSGQQHQICINQGQSSSSVANKTATSTVVSVASLMTTPTPVSGKAAVSGLLKIHSNQSSSPQQAVLTVPSQIKQLSVNTAPGGVQTILMPVNKVIQSLSTSKVSAATAVTSASTVVPISSTASVTKVKMEPDSAGQNCNSLVSQDGQAAVKTEESSELGNYIINIEHLENVQQLLTAIVKKVPLIAEKSEDVSSFRASSVEQYYSWNIGKRRAAEWQRAMTVRKILQEIIEKHPRFHNISPLKTKHVVHWCRCHGYTPPDPEALRNEEDSIEDVLTQIDSEPECPSSYTSGEELCRKLEELQQFLKQEPENDEEVDILSFTEPLKINIKKEQEEKQEEMKFYLASLPASEFVRDMAQKIGISFQPVELHKNIYASVIEDMVLKATEQLVNDILRQALAVGYQTAPQNRIPREITVMNIHQAICNIPFLDFLTNKNMRILNEEQ